MELPEGCIANIIARTTPKDACRLCAVSKLFKSAADSDYVWGRFLPSDVVSLVSHSQSHSSLITLSTSNKSLYLALSDSPIVIDQGKMSFQLDKKSGKKCYMLAARALTIVWGDTPRYWQWIPLEESRFSEVARLEHVWWLEIRGVLSTLVLTPNTHYAAYLVFSMEEDRIGFQDCPVELSIGMLGGEASTKNVILDPESDGVRQLPNLRGNPWLEIEFGVFFVSSTEDEQVQMSVVETEAGVLKSGLIIEGIEFRPKEDN
ncbi:hypothetical protein HN51_021943 [Arachis hypogaea]|uniref:F-box domain-containing protein n=2 Tax=Arachis TaxID=3817 RepID=A0A445EEM5_ARAHY|nr:putative F-box protein PP2-B12 [Arachis duranensis]XP_025646883.1 putative F-box protein PP2-B12 [Arachis hypogaea]XP_057741703.1 putative F-box protein PP2-B12 [Arachis stenosperma]QHO53049.1 Putative F-box protein [Arachis hypogaea]RYR73705.1 hypothetical protein Ahy_A02g008178 isoform A [Arachis hypogaea]RYR73706.1 hypothetical protein Ahy_A02g008178 isoform B [Arachis hypogaea]